MKHLLNYVVCVGCGWRLEVYRRDDKATGGALRSHCGTKHMTFAPFFTVRAHRREIFRGMPLLNAAARVGRGGNGRGSHQSQGLQEDHRALSRTAPHELAALALTVLNVNVPAGILQAAIAERAIDKDSLVQDEVLILKNLTLESIHA